MVCTCVFAGASQAAARLWQSDCLLPCEHLVGLANWIADCRLIISRNPLDCVFEGLSERSSLDDCFGTEFRANLVGCAFRLH